MKHNFSIYITIGGSDDFTIDTAGRVLAMGAVVFDSFGGSLNLFRREELFDASIFTKHFSRDKFMVSGVDVVTEVVIGCGGVDDVWI